MKFIKTFKGDYINAYAVEKFELEFQPAGDGTSLTCSIIATVGKHTFNGRSISNTLVIGTFRPSFIASYYTMEIIRKKFAKFTVAVADTSTMTAIVDVEDYLDVGLELAELTNKQSAKISSLEEAIDRLCKLGDGQEEDEHENNS